MSLWAKERRMVWETAQRMAARGLVGQMGGNASLRLGEEELLAITPTRRYYDDLVPEDIVIVDFHGEPVEGELVPSVETLLHIEIYKARRDVRAVLHTHSPYASALAIIGKGLPPVLDELVVYTGGEVKVAPYAFPGSLELARGTAVALGEQNALLLANHGVVGVGRDLKEALWVCELVERAAQAYILTMAWGELHLLPPEAIEAEKAIFAMRQKQLMEEEEA